jgi:hypothetical protein
MVNKMGRYAVVEIATGEVTGVIIWDGTVESGWAPPIGSIAIVLPADSLVGPGWSYVDGEFVSAPVPATPPPTSAEISALNTGTLQKHNQLAAVQKAALADRVGTLQDAIELEMATSAEVAELPVRQAQLLEWKRYAVFLGRVTLQAGWPLTVEWPVQPTDGMSVQAS